MKVGMIQSNYIPWRGYFDFIDDVNLFIFYDDVQYTHRDWRNRNKIKTQNGLMWLTVPVTHGKETLIQQAEINYQGRWVEKHIRTLTLAYKKAPFFKPFADDFFDLLRKRFFTISELNVTICKWIMKQLGIKTQIKMSSEFNVQGNKFDRPLEILKQIGATAYLSGPAAKGYTAVEKFKEAGIELEYKSYEYGEYPQLHGKFEPHVSVLDLLFNCGTNSRAYLKSLKENEHFK